MTQLNRGPRANIREKAAWLLETTKAKLLKAVNLGMLNSYARDSRGCIVIKHAART